MGAVGEMRMAIDEPWEDSVVRKVDHFCARRDCKICADRVDFVAADENNSIGKNFPTLWVDQFSGANGCDLG